MEEQPGCPLRCGKSNCQQNEIAPINQGEAHQLEWPVCPDWQLINFDICVSVSLLVAAIRTESSGCVQVRGCLGREEAHRQHHPDSEGEGDLTPSTILCAHLLASLLSS